MMPDILLFGIALLSTGALLFLLVYFVSIYLYYFRPGCLMKIHTLNNTIMHLHPAKLMRCSSSL